MSEFKFSCPKCGQKMFGDDSYAGTEITCPACQSEIVVPRMQPIPAGRLQVQTVTVVTPNPPPPPRPISANPVRQAYMPKDPGSDASKTKMIMTVVIICLVILGPIIFYVAFPDQVTALEHKFGFAGKKADSDEGGGQLGHIADLYAVLDATDPDKMFASDDKEMARMEKAKRAAEQAEIEAELAEANAPLGEISWNLNPTVDDFPTGKPHGSISGTTFVADIVRLDGQGNQFLLTMRQGTNAVADCEMLVYLQLKPDEQIEGKSWTVSASQKVGAPKVVKKWKANPKFAPLQKVYGGGYAMKLEFGESQRGKVPGRIYLALPDAEKSYVGGWFKVDDGYIPFRSRFDPDDF